MRTGRAETNGFFTKSRVAIAIAVLLALVGATVFVLRTRDDLHTARSGLVRSQQHLADLTLAQQRAVVRRDAARAALARAKALLRADTSARDRLLATNRVQLRRFTLALQALAQHQSALVAGATRAKLLDDCLVGASQVLNEAAVGDLAHLASTLPAVQQLCTQAAA